MRSARIITSELIFACIQLLLASSATADDVEPRLYVESKLNGVPRDDRQKSWRTGFAISLPLARGHRLQLTATEGISARVGSDFRTYTAAYTYAF